MALDVRRLLILRAVLRAGSITAAARDLGWTQPAVSQHLRALERDAGVPLLLRTSTGVTATEAGAALLGRADAVAAELHAAEEELAALAGLRAGRVRLQAFPSGAATLVPAAIEALARAHRGVTVGLEEAEPETSVPAVLAGDADLALAFAHDGPPADLGPLVWRPLLVEPVLLVTGPGRPAPSTLAALADEPWVGGCVRCRTHLLAACRAAGFEPALRHTTDDYVVVQNLVARGLGVTALPASALAAYRHPDVTVRPLAGLGERHVGVVHRVGADAVPATAALLSRLETVAAAGTSVRPVGVGAAD
ncbi:LysR family transcriptional regulator [Nocardioides bruguierae]|uniref:LysR family transcriptional regulator n=1 Tax=Nocardioides bruguierae TaxID=2945102 RepID=A0A9X2D6P5_9ACTN|nr:LysR family transcriptional regulator [Nocardioides bruguierae]MCM0620368.1 LysR family transcriptional regulator [Nocardioides bruguierae]